jgi:hypothetical protein
MWGGAVGKWRRSENNDTHRHSLALGARALDMLALQTGEALGRF